MSAGSRLCHDSITSGSRDAPQQVAGRVPSAPNREEHQQSCALDLGSEARGAQLLSPEPIGDRLAAP
jgi:hypothetical protein